MSPQKEILNFIHSKRSFAQIYVRCYGMLNVKERAVICLPFISTVVCYDLCWRIKMANIQQNLV